MDLPQIPKIVNEMNISQRIEFEVRKGEELFLFSYFFKLSTDFDNPENILVDCEEEHNIPANWNYIKK